MKSSDTLVEQLRQRSVRDLLHIADYYGLPYPKGSASEDRLFLIQVYDGTRGMDPEYLLDYSDGGKMWEEIQPRLFHSGEAAALRSSDPDGDGSLQAGDLSDEDDFLCHPDPIRYYEELHAAGNNLRRAIQEKDFAASVIAEHILDTDVFTSIIDDSSDVIISFLRHAAEASAGSTEDRASFWKDCSVDVHDRLAVSSLESKGLLRLKRIPATVDDVEEIVAAEMVPEVADMFRMIDTDEFNSKRRYLYWLSSCIILAKDYYEMPTADLVYKLLRTVRENMKDMFLPPFGDEFIRDLSGKLTEIYDFMITCESHGHIFLVDEIMEDHEDPGGFFNTQVQEYIDRDYDFYMPDFSEISEYDRYSYWPSREPWKRLHDWLRYYYLDEQTMSNMFSSMMNATSRISDPEDPNYMKPGYSMDDVEEDAMEKLMFIKLDLMMGNSAKDCLEYYPELTAGIREEALCDLREAVEDCKTITPWNGNMGYPEESVCEQETGQST